MPGEQGAVLRFAKLSEHAFAPIKGSAKAAGFDLKRFVGAIFQFMAVEVILKSTMSLVSTDGHRECLLLITLVDEQVEVTK